MCLLVHKFKASHILCFLQCALVGSARGQCDADTVPWPSLPMHTGKNRTCEALNLWTNKHITLFFRHPVCLLNHYDNVQYNLSDIVYLAYVYRNLWMPAKFWYQYVRVSHLGEELWILSSRRKKYWYSTGHHLIWRLVIDKGEGWSFVFVKTNFYIYKSLYLLDIY